MEMLALLLFRKIVGLKLFIEFRTNFAKEKNDEL